METLEEQLRRRLEALNRGPLPPGVVIPTVRRRPTAVATAPFAVRHNEKKQAAREGQTVAAMPGLVRRGEIVSTAAGEHWRVVLPIDELWPGGGKLTNARQTYLREMHAKAQQAVEPTVVLDAEFARFVAALPARAMCLDLETCGLSGAALFLIGILRHSADGPVVELLLARNYAEEAAVLASLWQIVAEHEVLLTFNGKSFDWPMVHDRSMRYRIDPAVTRRQLTHIDILHHSRRRWRKQLPNCRLQTLEQIVCRRRRQGDVASAQIPSIYADYVRTGFERDMDAVLYHNAIDLITLFDLALRLAG